ncbi:MAG: MFS transporter [bacterium]|nr:MFS transporter [bacterium]
MTPDRRYARYVLGILVLVYVFNFLDRQILAILAERIRADLGISDAQLGFLYGTAFAVFYAVFGIPLGRLADTWDRRRLIAVGLAAWSGMTMLSGFARTFGQLAAARIGVGVGEASAAPAAYSLLSDWFPPERRATALAIYSSGIYIGAGLGLGIGGLVVDRWDAAWGGGPTPFGLRGWQVAFLVVGLPGLLLAGWVATLREPLRGQGEGIVVPPHPHPFRACGEELLAVLPPFTLLTMARLGGRALAVNLAVAVLVTAAAWGLVAWLGTPAQWLALGVGVYAGVSWLQALARRDRPTFALLTRTPSLVLAGLGFALLAFVGYALGFWLPAFFMRVHGLDAARAGLVLGGAAAAGGWLGTTLGGLWADRLRRRWPAGRLHVGVACGLLGAPLAAWMLTTEHTTLGLVLSFFATAASSLWIGPGATTVQDLVMPRMRGTASAAYLMVVTFIGLALGPYVVGRLSVATGDLRTALLLALVAGLLGAACLAAAARHLAADEATRLARARAAGEPH